MNYVESFDLLGVKAKQLPCITGEGVPTTATKGAVGLLYMDTADNGKIYKCTKAENGVYTWVSEPDKVDTYTKAEIDNKLLSSLTYAGVVTSYDGYSMQPWQGSKPNELYTMTAERLSFSHGGAVTIPIQSVLDGALFSIDRTEYDDLIYAGVLGGYIYIGIGLKTSTDHSSLQPITLETVELQYVDTTYIDFIGRASSNSQIQDLASVDWSLYEIKYIDYTMEVTKGQGLVWTGNAWLTV